MERTWHSGPPPHIGWWNAGYEQQRDIWRWWDGKMWSGALRATSTPKYAAYVVKNYSQFSTQGIKWSDYYPPNARVPRVDPSKLDIAEHQKKTIAALGKRRDELNADYMKLSAENEKLNAALRRETEAHALLKTHHREMVNRYNSRALELCFLDQGV